MIDRDLIRSVFASTAWRCAADELAAALGVTICVLDLPSGANIDASRPSFPCDTILHTEPNPGLGCLRRTDRELDVHDPEPVRGVCEIGVRAIVLPVRFEGAVVCHAMVAGFVASTHERGRVLQRLLAADVPEPDARELVARIPVADRERAEAIGYVVAGRAAQFLADHEGVAQRTSRDKEMSLLADVARELGPVRTIYGDIPASALESLLRASGAERVMVWLPGPAESGPVLSAQAGGGRDVASDPGVAHAVSHVLGTGRSMLSTLPGQMASRTSIVAVPVERRGVTGGVLVLSKPRIRSLRPDDVRVAEVFAEVLGVMLDNAGDFVDANVHLVELLQANEVAQALNATLDFERLSELVTHVLGKQLTFEVGGFVIDGFGDHRGRIVHETDVSRREIAELTAEAAGSAVADELAPGIVIVGRGAELSENASEARREWTVLSRELRFRNMKAGDIFVASTASRAFTLDDERVLGVFAAHLSIALENAVLYEQLQADFGRALAALGALADATERLEHGHTDRVMDYAVAIGRELDLPIQRIGLLRFAGLLHDLGKIGLSEEILVKPSVLTDQEMELVRRHSEVGASIIEQVRVLEDLTPIVRHHHEHWDGTGYPDGLSGDAIPLEARVLAVADAYEAMTGKRVHRKRLSPAAARAELKTNSGTQFDPVVVDAFLTLLDRRALAGSTGLFADLANDAKGPHLPA